IAEVIAAFGLYRCRMLSLPRSGITDENMAGMIAKYLATSLVMENVVSAPRVMSSCLPISTISMSLVGLESRSTMFPASLAAEVPVFMATPTSAWANAGASLVPSPVIATSRPPSCSRLIRMSLSSGVASARKSSTPASSAIARAVNGLSPGIITLRMAIERSLDVEHGKHIAYTLGDVPYHQRGSAGGRDAVHDVAEHVGNRAALLADPLDDRVGRAFTQLSSVEVDARHPRCRGELDPVSVAEFA